MTFAVMSDPKGATGYWMDQLAAAFDRVCDPRDWMAPIRAVIQAGDQPVVEKAVLWFTDTVPRFEPEPGMADRLIVIAPGYRLGLAGRDEKAAVQETIFLPRMAATLASACGTPRVSPVPAPIIAAASRRMRRIEAYVRPLDAPWDGAIKRYDVFLTWMRWKVNNSSNGGAR